MKTVELPPRGYSKEDSLKRRDWLKRKTNFELTNIDIEPLNYKGIIENHIGHVKVPMAIAGPLLIDGDYAKGEFYMPLCTLEGTLTLSMTRGFYAMALSGGIKSIHVKQELSRSPLFVFESIKNIHAFTRWAEQHFDNIKKAAESTTKHGKLLRIESHVIHNRVILDFIYHTAEAAGQNMVTVATAAGCAYINEQYQSIANFTYLIESNFNGDKNPTYKSLIKTRGHHVVASIVLRDKYIKRVLRTSAVELRDRFYDMLLGSQLGGVIGLNLHVANALAAIYLATGQDVACVAENAVGIFTYELTKEGDLLAQLTMPSITIGTVGGGTRLPQQKKNLEFLGCVGENSSKN
jgi:hydroxymethylglutaryl-CoA reductase (NADPH)